MVKTEALDRAEPRTVLDGRSLEEIKQAIEESGAVRHGHFRLASGRHSEVYVEKFRVLERPWILEKVCRAIVDRFASLSPQVVAGPSTGGMIVAYEIARQLQVPAVYVETDDQQKRILKRGGHIDSGARVLLVDDVLTTGVSLQEVLPVIESSNADLIGVGVLIDRTEKAIDFGAPLFAASRFEATTYSEDNLPSWLSSIPVTVPGTRANVSKA